MMLKIEAVDNPIRFDDGNAYIGKTRVTLSTVVTVFNQGYSPDDIVDSFDVLNLAEVYATIAYYLQHKAEVDSYLAEQAAAALKFLDTMNVSHPKARKIQDKTLREKLKGQGE